MASWRNARGLARLFDFEEFEEDFDFLFGHAPTLRVAADLIASRIPPGRAVERMSVDDMVQNYDPAILFF